ncbi:MAG: hypothetical protein R2882_06010 [Gemmatimonadales bacterium]
MELAGRAPRVTEGIDGCRKRFWSDAPVRRTFQPLRRERGRAAEDTFACRFYDRLIRGAARERLLRTPLEVAVFVGSLGWPIPEVEELRHSDSLAGGEDSGRRIAAGDASFRQFVIGPGPVAESGCSCAGG